MECVKFNPREKFNRVYLDRQKIYKNDRLRRLYRLGINTDIDLNLVIP